MKQLTAIVFIALSAASPRASAQSRADSTTSAPTGRSHRSAPFLYAVVGGPGIETPTPYFFLSNGNVYQTQKRPMIFELEASKALWASGGKKTFFEYFVAVQPAVSVGGNVRYLFPPCLRESCFSKGFDVVEQRYTAYGVGLTPLGARVTTRLPMGAKFSIALTGGGVELTRPVPYQKAKQFNFQLTARPAIGVPIGNHGSFWAGYELFHMSNGNTSPINPGINAGLAMLGFQRAR